MALDDARGGLAREARSGAARAWVLAVRPRTLTIAVGPVLVGTGAGSAEAGRFDPAAMAVAAGLGGGFARAEYAVLLLAPFALLAALADMGPAAAMPLIALPWAARLAWTIHRRPPGRWLNGLLAETALLGLAFAGLLAASFGLQRAL